MNNLITQLREAAKRATPGPYGFFIGPTWITDLEKVLPENPRFERYEDAVFWSLCSPENILTLCELADAARELAVDTDRILKQIATEITRETDELSCDGEECEMHCALQDCAENVRLRSEKARAFLAKYFPKGD